MPLARVQARVSAELHDRREVVAREVRGPRVVQRAAGGRVGLRRQRSAVFSGTRPSRVVAAAHAAVARADCTERPRLVALVAAATRWRAGANSHAERHHALQHHHRHAGEQAAAALNCVCVLRIEGGEVDVGPG